MEQIEIDKSEAEVEELRDKQISFMNSEPGSGSKIG